MFLKYYVQFEARETLIAFDVGVQELSHQSNSSPMTVLETVIETYRADGVKQGVKQGLEQGLSLKEREIVVRLWNIGEFSMPKMALLVGVGEEQIVAIVMAHLLENDKTSEEAATILAEYRKRFEADKDND